MPYHSNTVPLYDSKVPPEDEESTTEVPENEILYEKTAPKISEKTEECDSMSNTQPEITPFIKEHIREIMPYLRRKAEEKGLKNEELMIATAIPHTTFYRMWKIGTADEEKERCGRPYVPDPDNVCRLCLAIGASLDEFQRAPSAESPVFLPALSEESHEKVIDNIWGEVQKNREAAESLESEKTDLLDRNAELAESLRLTREELRRSRERIDELTDKLISQHDQMHEINRIHSERIDKLNNELLQQYERIFNIFGKCSDFQGETK